MPQCHSDSASVLITRLLRGVGRWAGKPVNHTSWVAVVTPTDRPKSVRNCCLIELFCGVICVATLPLGHFCWYTGFCHRTGSDLLLFVFVFCICRTLRDFDVERSEISTSNAHKYWVLFWKWMPWQGQEISPCIYARILSDWPKNMEGRKTHNSNVIFLFYFYFLISILIFLFYYCILISILSFQIPVLKFVFLLLYFDFNA